MVSQESYRGTGLQRLKIPDGKKVTELQGYRLGCPKKTLFLSIILAVESLVRMVDLSHQNFFSEL